MIKGSYWLPASGAITAWLSSLLTPEAPFLLLCEEGKFEEIADRLLRIGYFNIMGYNKFSMDEWPEEVNSPKIIGFEEFKQLKDFTHVDVRNIPEF